MSPVNKVVVVGDTPEASFLAYNCAKSNVKNVILIARRSEQIAMHRLRIESLQGTEELPRIDIFDYDEAVMSSLLLDSTVVIDASFNDLLKNLEEWVDFDCVLVKLDKTFKRAHYRGDFPRRIVYMTFLWEMSQFVEILKAEETSDQSVAMLSTLAEFIGFYPIILEETVSYFFSPMLEKGKDKLVEKLFSTNIYEFDRPHRPFGKMNLMNILKLVNFLIPFLHRRELAKALVVQERIRTLLSMTTEKTSKSSILSAASGLMDIMLPHLSEEQETRVKKMQDEIAKRVNEK